MRWAWAVVAAAALLAPYATAGTITVNTTEDELDFVPNGKCSLREAVVTINEVRSAGVGGCSVSGTLGSNDTIQLGAGTYALTRQGSQLLNDQDRDNLNLLVNVKIVGVAPGSTTVDGTGVGTWEGGIFHVAQGVTAEIRSMTIANGFSSQGGAIFNRGTLTLQDVDLRDHFAEGWGGAIHNAPSGVLTVRSSLIRSTVANNGGGLYNSGDATLVNTTVTGNEANNGGGVFNNGDIFLSSVTITGNSVRGTYEGLAGGGLLNRKFGGAETLLENTLIAGNRDDGSAGQPDCAGTVQSLGWNLVGDGTGCTGLTGTDDQVGTTASPIDPHLAGLANNGGPTRTHRLLSDSPAIDGGPLGILEGCLDTDQRGQPRPNDGDGNGFTHCDIGAFEAPAFEGPPTADLSVSMSDDPDPVAAGGTLTFSLRIENAGPDTAQDAAYTMTFPSGTGLPPLDAGSCTLSSSTSFTCTVGDLAGGQAVDVDVVVDATTSVGTWITTAAVDSPTDDPDPGDNEDQEATIVASADSTDLVLSMTGPAAVVLGETISYLLEATNLGPDSADNVVVANQFPPNTRVVSVGNGCSNINGFLMSCPVGTLAAGAKVGFGLVVEPTRLGTVTNTASVSGGSDADTSNNSDSLSTLVSEPPSADLFVALNAPANVAAGAGFVYTVIPFNNGPDAAGGVTVSLDLDPDLTFATAPSFCDHASGTVTCVLGILEPFGTVTSIEVEVAAPDAPGTSVSSVASIAGDDDDPFADNDQATASTNVVSREADVRIAKTGPAEAAVDSDIAYQLQVTNAGPDAAQDVTVDDALPVGTTLLSASPECSLGSGEVTCALGTLASGASKALTILVRTPPAGGAITNTATVQTSTDDPDGANDTDSATTDVRDDIEPPGDSPLTVSVSPGPSAPADADVSAGQAGVPVVQALLSNVSTVDARVTSFAVAIAGTRDAAGDLAAVHVYLDEDGDGAVGGADTLVASGAASTGTVTLAADVDLVAADNAYVLIAVDVRSDLASWPLAPLASLGGLALSFGLLRRRRARVALLVAFAAAALAIGSCSAPPPAQGGQVRSYAFALSGVDAVVAAGGAVGNVTGLPVDGATLRVRP